MKAKPIGLVLGLVALASAASAMYVRVEIQDVPLERLISNLEAALAKAPDDAQLHHHLARTLAMAWAKRLGGGSSVAAVGPEGEPTTPWFGYGEGRELPFAAEGGGPAEPEARAYLDRAIAEYERASSLRPEDVLARVGLAWCREQAGDLEAARRDYREILEQAWKKDEAARAILGTYVSSEVIGYLLPLLDAVQDADEIADLERKRETLESRPRAITPIAVPLADDLGPGDLLLGGPGVSFDLDGSGLVRPWQWISSRAAWLVWDPEGRGVVRSALQLLGSRSFLLFPADGYEALALLDDDGDGALRGRELQGLALWADANADGLSQPGEVQPLAAWGITGLSCRSRRHAQGLLYSPGGVELEGGRRRDSFDLVLSSR